ncbi:MAG: hypothetical protein WC023_06365 [Rhodocyclaceae bacterium]
MKYVTATNSSRDAHMLGDCRFASNDEPDALSAADRALAESFAGPQPFTDSAAARRNDARALSLQMAQQDAYPLTGGA